MDDEEPTVTPTPDEVIEETPTTDAVPIDDTSNVEKEVSISPREKLKYSSDRKYLQQVTDFLESNPAVPSLLAHMKTDILIKKPANILDFLVDEYFVETNQISLTNYLDERDTIARKLDRGLDLDD